MRRRRDKPRVTAELLRIVLAFTLFAMIAYVAVAPREMIKVKAEIVTVSFAALTIVIQFYVIFSQCYTCLPYAISPVIALDALCGICWCVSIVVLAYWDREVVYMPREGDPSWWFECANAAKWEDTVTYTANGDYVTYINILWCEVDVDGHRRLVGNSRAREQLHVMIALSAMSLLFSGLIIAWTVRQGRALGLIVYRRGDLEARADAASDTSSTWSR